MDGSEEVTDRFNAFFNAHEDVVLGMLSREQGKICHWRKMSPTFYSRVKAQQTTEARLRRFGCGGGGGRTIKGVVSTPAAAAAGGSDAMNVAGQEDAELQAALHLSTQPAATAAEEGAAEVAEGKDDTVMDVAEDQPAGDKAEPDDLESIWLFNKEVWPEEFEVQFSRWGAWWFQDRKKEVVQYL